MHSAVYVIGIIIQFFVATQCQCPNYIQYFRNETTGEVMGMVEVAIPAPPKAVPLHLRVLLSVNTALSSDHIKKTHIELVKSKEDSIRSVLDGNPISYRIYFPIRYPIPEITSITLNEIPFCTREPSDRRAINVIVTIEHDLYPSRLGMNISELSYRLVNLFSNHASSSTSPGSNSTPRTTRIPAGHKVVPDKNEKNLLTSTLLSDYATIRLDLSKGPSTSKPKQEIDSMCSGVTSDSSAAYEGIETISATTWPWSAVIFVRYEDDQLEFKCNGNLISSKHILTAAHCLEDEEGEKIPEQMLVVSLGRSNLYDDDDQESVYANVFEYKMHPDYEENPISADSDLALINLEKPIEYNPRIRSLCLYWMEEQNLESIVGKSGFAFGWREHHEKNPWYKSLSSIKPRIFKLPIVSQEDCLTGDAEFFGATSDRTFCSGNSDGEGLRNIDSGSGFVIYDSRLGQYQLRGIISISFKNYTVYVDIAKHQSWIFQEMND